MAHPYESKTKNWGLLKARDRVDPGAVGHNVRPLDGGFVKPAANKRLGGGVKLTGGADSGVGRLQKSRAAKP